MLNDCCISHPFLEYFAFKRKNFAMKCNKYILRLNALKILFHWPQHAFVNTNPSKLAEKLISEFLFLFCFHLTFDTCTVFIFPFLPKKKQSHVRYKSLFMVGVHCFDSIPADL